MRGIFYNLQSQLYTAAAARFEINKNQVKDLRKTQLFFIKAWPVMSELIRKYIHAPLIFNVKHPRPPFTDVTETKISVITPYMLVLNKRT